MNELNTGVDKFVIIDRLVFFSALILTVVAATATTTHPYQSKAVLENPADLLSFEYLLNDNPEVPVAGDIEPNTQETPEKTPEKVPEEKAPEEDEIVVETPQNTPAPTTTKVKQPASVKSTSDTPSKKPQSNIDWNTIHVDDNGETFDNGEVPGSITPAGSEFPAKNLPIVENEPSDEPSAEEEPQEAPEEELD